MLKYVFALLMSVVTANSYALGHSGIKLPGLGGGSGGDSAVNWDDVAGTGQNAIVDIYKGTQLLIRSTAEMAEAIGLKEQAALLYAQAKKIKDDGSVTGDYDLGEAAKQTSETMDLIEKALSEAKELTAQQKEAVGKSVAQYVVGGIRYIKGMKSIKDVASQASDAPMTKMMQFKEIIGIAPTAVEGAKAFFGKIPQVIKLMKTKGIQTPANVSEMSAGF